MVLGIILGIVVILAIILFSVGYFKAPPDKAYIISGKKKEPKVYIGKAGIKIPFLDRLDKLDLSLIPIQVRTSEAVPTLDYINVRVNSSVNIKIGTTEELLKKASTHFLNMRGSNIGEIARETLEASVREIIGTMSIKDMVTNREQFCKAVTETAEPDLAKMGLEIVSFNVQDFADEDDVIKNLGIDNIAKIQKVAKIAKAQSERDVAIEQAKASKEANDAKIAAAEQIAEREAQLKSKKAALQREVDTQQAQADAAMSIEAENQRKLREVAETEANIAKAEREAELKQQQIQLKEYELDALVRKQADADKYAAEQKAEVELIRRKKAAEAKAYEIKQEAEAIKAKADADKYAAEQQAAGIEKIGVAEALAIEKKAEAQKKMGEASVVEMYLKALPQIVASAAGPLENVDSITMYGEGNSSAMVGDVMKSVNQVNEGLKANGIDLSAMLGGFFGAKTADNN
jgi:flotillin